MNSMRAVLAVATVAFAGQAFAQQRTAEEFHERVRALTTRLESGLAEPFKGVTTNGTPIAGLYPLRSTGVSTEPVNAAARAFLATLGPEQQNAVRFSVDDDEWRKWANMHAYARQGISFAEMTDLQRA